MSPVPAVVPVSGVPAGRRGVSPRRTSRPAVAVARLEAAADLLTDLLTDLDDRRLAPAASPGALDPAVAVIARGAAVS